MPSYATLNRLAATHGDSYYLFHPEVFRRNWDDFRAAFRRIYSRTELGYSYKTNYIPALCRYVDDWGGLAEVVSILEYEMAIRLGVDPDRIIFNGPYKPEPHLLRAFEAGSVVNVDSIYEVLAIERIARSRPDLTLRLGVRCAFEIGEDSPTRFGFDVGGGDFAECTRRLARLPNGRLEGLHCHFMPPGRKAEAYGGIARRMLLLAERVFRQAPPRFIDIGGGFFSRMKPEMRRQFGDAIPTFDDYAEAIATPFAEAFPAGDGPNLILEPGMAVVADSMQFTARVVDVKTVAGRKMALLAGSIYDVRPTKSRRNLPIARIADPSGTGRSAKGPLDLVGYTCMEDDVLHRGFTGEIAAGDFVVFDNVGAYTVVLKPPFILPAWPVLEVVDDGGGVRELKRAETLDDLLKSYTG